MRFVCFDDVVSLRRALLYAGEGKGSVGVDASACVWTRLRALLENPVSLRLLPRHFGLAQWHCHANIHLLGMTALTLKRIWSGMRTVCSVCVFVVPSQKYLPQFFEGIYLYLCAYVGNSILMLYEYICFLLVNKQSAATAFSGVVVVCGFVLYSVEFAYLNFTWTTQRIGMRKCWWNENTIYVYKSRGICIPLLPLVLRR